MKNCECDGTESHMTQLDKAGGRDGAGRVVEKNFWTALCLQTRCWERFRDLRYIFQTEAQNCFCFQGYMFSSRAKNGVFIRNVLLQEHLNLGLFQVCTVIWIDYNDFEVVCWLVYEIRWKTSWKSRILCIQIAVFSIFQEISMVQPYGYINSILWKGTNWRS